MKWIVTRGRREQEMEAEPRTHVEMRTEHLVRQGIRRDEAGRRAKMEFGGIEQVREGFAKRKGSAWRRRCGRTCGSARGC